MSQRSGRLHLEFDLGKLSKMSKDLNVQSNENTDHHEALLSFQLFNESENKIFER